jgi:hypothetical protein
MHNATLYRMTPPYVLYAVRYAVCSAIAVRTLTQAVVGDVTCTRESTSRVRWRFWRGLITRDFRCGGITSLHFVVKQCSLLYLYANNGTFAQAPYLDVHGEVDISTRCALHNMFHGQLINFAVDEGRDNTSTFRGGKKFGRRDSIMVF